MEKNFKSLITGTALATLLAIVQGDTYAKKLLTFTGIILTGYVLKLEFAEDKKLAAMLAELQQLASAEALKERSN